MNCFRNRIPAVFNARRVLRKLHPKLAFTMSAEFVNRKREVWSDPAIATELWRRLVLFNLISFKCFLDSRAMSQSMVRNIRKIAMWNLQNYICPYGSCSKAISRMGSSRYWLFGWIFFTKITSSNWWNLACLQNSRNHIRFGFSSSGMHLIWRRMWLRFLDESSHYSASYLWAIHDRRNKSSISWLRTIL